MRYRDTHRFDTAVFAAIALVTTGTVLGNGTLFMAAGVPVTYLVVGALTRPPAISSLSVERSFDPELPAPGERTTVALSVKNDGDRTVPDVRLVDRLPESVPVSDGSPRGGVALRPGEEESITYEIVPSQGDHEFGSPLVRLRPLPAVGTVTGEASVDETTLRCRRGVSGVPQTRGSLRRVGTQATDTPGTGLEFHSVREYRPGDDINRIDWRTLAKTGELSTVNFDETRATKTVLIVDGRLPARCSRDAGYPTGAELSAYVADRTFERLIAAGNHVGLTALGIDASDVETTLPSDRSGRPWVPLGNDPATRTRVGSVLDAVVDVSQAEQSSPTSVADGGVQTPETADLRASLPSTADIVITTPLLDETPVEMIETLAGSHSIVIVSPDVTGDGTPGARAAHIRRQLRIRRLRTIGTTVIDWETTDPLSAALEAAR